MMLVAEMNQVEIYNMTYVIVAVAWLAVGVFVGMAFGRMAK